MPTEHTDEALQPLIELETVAWNAHLELRRLQDQYGKPISAWTPEQHAAWDAQWKVVGDTGNAFQASVTAYAEATDDQDRGKLEMRVKKAVRHPQA